MFNPKWLFFWAFTPAKVIIYQSIHSSDLAGFVALASFSLFPMYYSFLWFSIFYSIWTYAIFVIYLINLKVLFNSV